MSTVKEEQQQDQQQFDADVTKPRHRSNLPLETPEAFSRLEEYVNRNKNIITAVVGGLVLLISGYFAFKYLYLEPKEIEGQKQIFVAQRNMESGQLEKALNGDNNYPGFLRIIDEYKWTKAANLSHYYAGSIYLQQGKFDDAISHLKDFDGKKTAVQAMAFGLIGDAYTEKGNFDEGIDHYKKAAYTVENEATTPFFLKKAALALEHEKKNDEALKLYKEIKSKYPNSAESRDAEKAVFRLEASTTAK